VENGMEEDEMNSEDEEILDMSDEEGHANINSYDHDFESMSEEDEDSDE
jgi:hypothetical protein